MGHEKLVVAGETGPGGSADGGGSRRGGGGRGESGGSIRELNQVTK